MISISQSRYDPFGTTRISLVRDLRQQEKQYWEVFLPLDVVAVMGAAFQGNVRRFYENLYPNASTILSHLDMIDELGKRLKSYEHTCRYMLPPKSYLILRLDGKAFHTFTRKLEKPYCQALADALDRAAETLCKEIMGCEFAFGQSDEYSFLVTDLSKDTSEMWFGGNVQKIASVSASIFTAEFNRAFYADGSRDAQLAAFDSRVFPISQRSDVEQYFHWRQADACRNSLNAFASCHFPHSMLMGKNSGEKRAMLEIHDLDWMACAAEFRRGRILRKIAREQEATFTNKISGVIETKSITKTVWEVDRKAPWFKHAPHYLDSLIPNVANL